MSGFEGQGLACIRNERIVFAALDYSLAPGGALILAGANGSGKSSLLRLMAGLGRPAAGRILWNGRPVADDPEGFAACCHYLGHRDAVKPALTVGENLAFHATLRRRAGGASVGEALDRMGLLPLSDMPARMLSAGQTRRLAFARVLATPATLWLLDEPTVALDPSSVAAVMDAIARHRSEGGMIVASTNVPMAISAADTIDMSGFGNAGATLWGDAA